MKAWTALFLLPLLLACAHSTSSPSAPVAAVVDTSGTVCPKPGPHKLLIIGDSISMGYTTYLQKDLCAFYDVQHVGHTENTNEDIENAQGTTHTLANVDRWLAQAGPLTSSDVITWNNGLWNARDPATDPQAPGNATDLTTYQTELEQIALRLKATGARVIFFTTTDIPTAGSTFIAGRDLDENTTAGTVMDAASIEHYDLNALARSNPKLHLSNDPIHFNTQGYSLFGEYIADMVRANFETSN